MISQIGLDGRVVDTPEVVQAKAEHAAAQINERINLARETVRSADAVIVAAAPQIPTLVQTRYEAPIATVQVPYPGFVAAPAPLIHHVNALYPTGVVANAPLHLVNHVVSVMHQHQPANVQIVTPAPVPIEQQAMIGEDGFPLETPEVIAAKAAHAQAHAEAKAASEAADMSESEM